MKLTPDNILLAANRLITELGVLAEEDDAVAPQRLEQCAKALCSQLKAIQDLEAHNLRQSQAKTGQKYTRYEDLPPLMPEDRDRLEKDLIKLLSTRDTDTTKFKL